LPFLISQDPVASREFFGIQILRGIAALSVVFHHTLEETYGAVAGARTPDWLTTAGAAGVDIFFVISGFIMLYVSFPSSSGVLKPGDFLLRRITRIYPIYWVCCAAVIALWGFGLFASKPMSIIIILKSVFLLPTPDTLIGVSWTLSYEIYFYLIFAATLGFRSRTASVMISISAIVTILVAAQASAAGDMAQFLANPISIEFCFGLLLARFWQSRLRMLTAVGVSILGFAIIATAPLYVYHASTNGLPNFARTIVWGLPAACILCAFISIGPPKGVASRFAVLIGDASYAIYLTHFFVMVVYARILKSTAVGLQSQVQIIPIVIGACVAVGLTVHFALERPILNLIRNFVREKKRLVVPQTKVQAP
jgi:exopolysaccharide production protein ExoZ